MCGGFPDQSFEGVGREEERGTGEREREWQTLK